MVDLDALRSRGSPGFHLSTRINFFKILKEILPIMLDQVSPTKFSPIFNTRSSEILNQLSRKSYAFGELIRVYKPQGWIVIDYAYIHGFLYALSASNSSMTFEDKTLALIYMSFGAFTLRSWACAWNDIADRHLDRLVARCCKRPMARGAISYPAALIFTLALTAVWYTSMNATCPSFSKYGPALLFLASLYPYTKRFTHHTPIFLGATFAMGILIGCAMGGIDPLEAIIYQPWSTGFGILALYFHWIVWTVMFETVYAFQDIRDDTKVGIRSMAIRYQKCIRPLLATLAILQVSLLIATGYVLSANLFYYLLAPALNAALVIWMVRSVDFTNPADCGWWFANTPLLAGPATIAGLAVNYCL